MGFTQLEVTANSVNKFRYVEIGQRLSALFGFMRFRTRREFCAAFGVTETAASNWFSGRSRINQDDGARICERAGVPIGYLYHGDMRGLPVEFVDYLNKNAA